MEVIFMRIIGIMFILLSPSVLLFSRMFNGQEKEERKGKIAKCKCKVIGKILDYEAILIGDYYAKGSKFGGYKAKVSYEFEGEEFEVYDLARPYEEIYKRNEEIELLVDENNPKYCYDVKGLELETDNKKTERFLITAICAMGLLLVTGNIKIVLPAMFITIFPYMIYLQFRMVIYLSKDLSVYNRKIKNCTKKVKAIIVRMEYRFLKISNNGLYNSPEGVSAVVRFNVDGEEVIATSMNKAFFRVYKPGNEIEIFYNPDDVSCCYDNIGNKYGVRIFSILLFSFIMVILMAIFLIFLLMLVNGIII
ncbi:MAG: hypothetical protein K6G26_06525 [Lachnospiraceae bacterium]|nr:hypothetical protein [Lachnospiraceae bacterium]